ncbi:ABC transporter permease [Halobellus ruber]|uniref:ABC transporter permease n=1 Tax=Halobellus ruber TaxID=2761102 RepID=A0A7J9SGC0_9EURY|nr:ABC transporter permease [Halobellus ruber]MBB6646014.1 ABC transporter permease [Halobellus ruber]
MSLYSYIGRRTLGLLPKLLLASGIVFALVQLTPGDPVTTLAPPRAGPEELAAIRAKWRLDEPVYIQYLAWMGNLLQGDLGVSVATRNPVTEMIAIRAPISLRFSLLALAISYGIAIPFGIIGALKQHTKWDYLSMGFVLLAVSFPSFWFAIILILIFAIQLQWVSAVGYGTLGLLVLPAVALGLRGSAIETRVMRSSMIETLNEKFITASRAHGLPERNVILKHAVRNALIPIITLLGLRFGYILASGLVIEIVFNRPGVGHLLVDSIFKRDYPVVRAILMILVTTIMLGNFLADVLYGLVDPRIRYE